LGIRPGAACHHWQRGVQSRDKEVGRWPDSSQTEHAVRVTVLPAHGVAKAISGCGARHCGRRGRACSRADRLASSADHGVAASDVAPSVNSIGAVHIR
jgi:hypothetical protein